VTLRLTPLNADVLYADVGAEATTASRKLGERVFKTTDLEVSFLAVDSSGRILVADRFNQRVRRVDTTTGIITTIAGDGEWRFAGDGGPASAASLAYDDGLAFDATGNLYIADSTNLRVRLIPACVTLATPALSSPQNGSSGVATAPRLVWNRTDGAFRYDVYLDTVSPPRTIAIADVALTTASPTNLAPLTTYYWRVVAKGDPYCAPVSTAESVVRSFATGVSCDAPGEP